MNLLIVNNFHFHYEIYGYIIDFCKKKNYHLDILSDETNNLGIISWYKQFFQYQHLRFVKKIHFTSKDIFNDKNEPYDFIIFTTDDDISSSVIKSITDITNTNIYYKSICIDHSFQLRNPFCYNHIGIRHYHKRNINYVYPCYPVVDYIQKKQFLLNCRYINITLIARLDKIKDLVKEYKKIIKLDGNILVNHIYYLESENKEYYNELIIKVREICYLGKCNHKLYFHWNLSYDDLDKVMKHTNYVYIPEYKESCKYDKFTGAIQLAFNYGCKIIFPEQGYKDSYQLFSMHRIYVI